MYWKLKKKKTSVLQHLILFRHKYCFSPCFPMQMWRMAWPPLCLTVVTMVMVVTWMQSSGHIPWRCPSWLHPPGISRQKDRAAIHRRPSWRPRSESFVCWWSSSSCSFSAGCLCTVPTPGGLSITCLPKVPSQGHLSLLSIYWAIRLPASTRLFTASWTHASGRLSSPPSRAALHLAVTAAVVGYVTTKRMLWQQGHPCLSSVTLQSAPWEAAEGGGCRHNPEKTVTTVTQHPAPFVFRPMLWS